MGELLAVFNFLVQMTLTIGLTATVVILGLWALSRPALLLLPILLVVMLFKSTSYGSLDASGPSIFSRGSGVFLFPLLFWGIFLSLLLVQISKMFHPFGKSLSFSLRPWFVAWTGLLVLHTVVGLLIGHDIRDILGFNGFVNIIWMGLFIALILSINYADKEIQILIDFLMLVALARVVFGMVRWAFLGGDPSNVYANYGGINIKLSFFEINDNVAALLGFSIASVRLSRGLDGHKKFFYFVSWILIVSAPICIMLSYRRTVWLGFLLAGVFILIFLTKRQRSFALIAASPVIFIGLLYVAQKRLSETRGAGGLSGFFHEFIGGSAVGRVNQRQMEIIFAWRDFLESPVVGIGAWGRYGGSSLIEWQADSAGAFLHSGVLHIALKSGLIGLFLLFGLYISFAVFVVKYKNKIPDDRLPLFVAGVAGILMLIPDMIIGTPIPQVRTMLMYGLCFALPYVAAMGIEASSRLSSMSIHGRAILTSASKAVSS